MIDIDYVRYVEKCQERGKRYVCRGECTGYVLPEDNMHIDGCPALCEQPSAPVDDASGEQFEPSDIPLRLDKIQEHNSIPAPVSVDDVAERTFEIWNGICVDATKWDELEEHDQIRWRKMIAEARKDYYSWEEIEAAIECVYPSPTLMKDVLARLKGEKEAGQ